MSIRSHARLVVLVQILTFVPVFVLWFFIDDAMELWWQVAIIAPLLVLAALFPFAIFCKVVPARCPQARCGGNAYASFPKPPDNQLLYRCSACSGTFDSHVQYDGYSPD